MVENKEVTISGPAFLLTSFCNIIGGPEISGFYLKQINLVHKYSFYSNINLCRCYFQCFVALSSDNQWHS